MTYSILARERDGGGLGIAVQSKFPGAGVLVPYGRAGVAVVATQAFADPAHGERGIELLALGVPAEDVPGILMQRDARRGERQVAVLSAHGMGVHTGAEVRTWDGWAGHAAGEDCLAVGNSLAGPQVVQAMVDTYEAGEGEMAARLIDALRAGERAGGELRGQQSACVRVFREDGGYGGRDGRHVDIPVYDHPSPIEELARCYRLHRLSWFPSNPDDLIPVDEALARELKEILRREGFLAEDASPGAAWDDPAVAAMRRFMGNENYDNRIRDDALVDREVLEDIRRRRA